MNQSFFIGAVGAHQQLKRLTVHGNNIANLNTYGFKAEKSRFASLVYDDVKATAPTAWARRFGPRTRISRAAP